MLKGLFTTITNVNFYNDTICALLDEVNKEKEAIAPQTDNYDVQTIWDGDEDIRSLKSLILFGLKGIDVYKRQEFMPFKMRIQEDGMIKIYKTEESIVNEIEKVEDRCV